MDINRNQWFMIGIVLLLLGVQLKLVDSYVLNERVSQKIAERSGNPVASPSPFPRFLSTVSPTPRKVIEPPSWLGWAVLSVGAVVTLHSLAMKKPGD